MNYKPYVSALTGAAVATTLLMAPVARSSAQGNRTVTLNSGTVIPVKLNDTLSSTDSRNGDRFTATLQSVDTARSLGLPVGTTIEGTVSGVRAMQGKDPGVLALNFNRIILPNESSYPIKGSLIGLDSKSVNRDSNGRLTAKADQKNKTLIYAGYGAGAGLILGALTKGNTILDTVIGGGLGYLLGSLDKSHGDPRDVVLKPNTELGVRLDRNVNVKYYDDGTLNGNSDTGYYHRTNTDRNGNPIRTDPNNDPYDDRNSNDRNSDNRNYDRTQGDRNSDNRNYDRTQGDRNYDRNSNGLGSYEVLSQYTNLRDNGQTVNVIVSGREMSFLSNARPYFSNGTVMVPVIPILKADNDRYTYTSSQFTAYGPGEALTGSFNSKIVTGSGTHRFTLPASIQRRNGTIYVPMQFLSVVTGKRLQYNSDTQTVELGGSRPRYSQP